MPENEERKKYYNGPWVDLNDKPYKENFKKIEKEFAEAAKDGTLYERYSEYLKQYEEILKNPDFADSVYKAKEEIIQLKAAYFEAAGLSRKICPECGQIYEKDAKFCKYDASEIYMVGKCRSCGADLSSAQEYSAINSCPKCGADLAEPQKKIINEILVKTLAKTKYACTKCGKIYDRQIKHCEDCGSKVLPMQCSQCGETLRLNDEGQFAKYCPKCGMLNPAEVEQINQKQKKQLQKQAEEAEKRRLEAEKERIRQEYEEKLKAAYAKVSEAERQRQLEAWQRENERLMREQEKLRLEEENRKREEEYRTYLIQQEEKRRQEEYEAKLRREAARRKREEEEKARQEAERRQKEAEKKAKSHKIGDKITFGSYPFYEDGRKKAIDWIILDIDASGNALVISDYALDNVSYNEQFVKITWENSSIRKWLNETFINKAFTPEQRSKIIESRIANNDDAGYGTRGGNATNDKLFLLSIEEAEKYFKYIESRIAYPTPYAKSKKSVNGNLTVSEEIVSTERGGSCWWWLRSPGSSQISAACVDYDGFFHAGGSLVDNEIGSVRAALKINLNNL